MLTTKKTTTEKKILSLSQMEQNTKDSTTTMGTQNTSSTTPRNHKLFGGSSYDRYLDVLLEMWPEIKNKYPDATLDIAYGWDLFDKVLHNNPERQQWKRRLST